MKADLLATKSRGYRMWERSYVVIIISFVALTSISLGYGLWAAFQFSDSNAPTDLARLITSGFLFIFSGLAAVAMWLRLINVQDNRWVISQISELLESRE